RRRRRHVWHGGRIFRATGVRRSRGCRQLSAPNVYFDYTCHPCCGGTQLHMLLSCRGCSQAGSLFWEFCWRSEMEIAKRLKSIPPYVFAEIDKKRQAVAARGVDVINLGIGDPDQPTPKFIVEAMQKALDNPANHKYRPFGGMPEYKQAIAQWCAKRFGFTLDPASEITSLIGSKEGIHNIIMAYVDEGDVVLVPDPAYPVYKSSTI